MRKIFLFLMLFFPVCLQAETTLNPVSNSGYPDFINQSLILILVALLPFAIMLLTSFLKIVITLALLRNALGVQQTPPNAVINGMALLLTIYVMFPTGLKMYEQGKPILETARIEKLVSADSAAVAMRLINTCKEPLRDFLIRNSTTKSLNIFYKLSQKTFPPEINVKQQDFIVVIPAFITQQVKAAFEIGTLIFLPFFVIDLVTSNILLAMQMMMLSPLSISLPLKLLLLVMVDGWTILTEGLVLSFNR